MRHRLTQLLDKRLAHWDWEKILYLALIVIALATRLWGLGIRVQSHDESLHTKYSWDLYVGNGFRHTPLMHGPFLFHATALSYFLFGDNDFTARLAVALISVAVVAFPYLLRRWLGRLGALATAFFLLISPSIAYYSRYIRHDLPVILWTLIVIFATFSYLHDGRERWLYLMAGGISLMFATKEVAFIYNAIIGFFLIGLLISRALAHPWFNTDKDLKSILNTLRHFRSFDLIILLGTLCLPFLSPILISLAGLDPIDYSPPTIYYSGAITVAVLLISIGIGLAWNWRKWSIAAAIHYAIFVILFTTFFTNGTGIASGMIGSMGYWLAQQGVKRGDQPWYYYGIILPMYDYLPLLLTFVTATYLAVRSALRDPSSTPSITRYPSFLVFLLWWTVTAWAFYSYAGEKMPWLTVHLALPMIILSGWALGSFVENINWRRVFRRRVWLLALIAPPFVMALGAFIYAVSSDPFQGTSLAQLNITGQLIGASISMLLLGAGMVYWISRSGWRTSWRLLLLVALLVSTLLTIRTSWRFCYINYSYPIEHLVYAHAGPAVKDTMRQIEELSRRVAGGPKLIKVAYGADGSWPFHWYLRDYDNAAFYGENPSREQLDVPVVIAGRGEWDDVAPYMSKDYVANTYTFLWWPMEDYKGLTWERIRTAITNPRMRAALWDIWYNRDYRRYDEVVSSLTGTEKNHSLDEWPLRSEYRLYIRRDITSQIWDLGVTEGELAEIGPVDPYEENWQNLAARKTFGTQGSEDGQFQNPRGITIGPEGFVYVADAGNHRIQKFTAEGDFVTAWGRHSPVEAEAGQERGFNEPWDVAIAPNGDIYVADTWNHRIQKLNPEGEPVTAWGLFGQYSPEDGEIGQSAFYGPRGIAINSIDESSYVYVTDTGNKRVQVFDLDGEFAFQWGGGGVAEGYLDEPVGIAFSRSDGQSHIMYVADTWNQRVQAFDPQGDFLHQWPIEGWDAGIPEEKPYLAVDAEGRVYVTDPGYYRVLVFDSTGNYLLSFGQYGTDERSFKLPQGIAVSKDGSIYVTDAHNHRVLIFAPLSNQ